VEEPGTVPYAKVSSDGVASRSRGCGFVTFTTDDDADAAIAARDGSDLDGRSIRVNIAENKPRRDNRGGGGGGGGRW